MPQTLISKTEEGLYLTPEPPPIVNEVYCSCVKTVREFIPNLPRQDADQFISNTSPSEGVAVLFEYSNGTHHIAYLHKMTSKGFYIKQGNKIPCEYSEEFIEWSNPFIRGFYTPGSYEP